MKLWLLNMREEARKGPWWPTYDCSYGHVVRAETEQDARHLAASACGDEKAVAWLGPEHSDCAELTAQGPAAVLLTDFAAG